MLISSTAQVIFYLLFVLFCYWSFKYVLFIRSFGRNHRSFIAKIAKLFMQVFGYGGLSICLIIFFVLAFDVIPIRYEIFSDSKATSLGDELRTDLQLKTSHFYKLSVVSGDELYSAYHARKEIEAFRRIGKLALASPHSISIEWLNYTIPISESMGRKSKLDSINNASSVASHFLNKPLLVESFYSEASGSSAGLMMTLELIHHQGNDDLLNNRKICGTGTIDDKGIVHPIGELHAKLQAADKANCEITFIPAANKNLERILKREVMQTKIIAVRDVSEAIDKLKSFQ